MDSLTRQALNAINRTFYDAQAQDFSGTRNHPWPGWTRLLPHLTGSGPLRTLDVGCGNARFAQFLADGLEREVDYTGLDASAPLLEIARQRAPDAGFLEHDLVLDAPSELPSGPFDLIALFGVTHHLPGAQFRTELMRELAARLAPAGLLVLTYWQFGSEERFRNHRVSWESQPIDPEQLEAGDQLVRWGTSPGSLRYCHDTSTEERTQWTTLLPLRKRAEFAADGRSGELNHYLVFERI